MCQECYVFLTGHVVLEDREGKPKGILEVSSACPPCVLVLCPSCSELCHPPWSPASLSQPSHAPAAGEVGVTPAAVRGCLLIARLVDVLSPPPSRSVSLGTRHPGISAGPSQPGPPLACPRFGGGLWSRQGIPQEMTFAQCPFCRLHRVFRDLFAGFLAERSRRGIRQEFAVQFPAAAGQERQGGHAGLVRDPAG